MEAEDIGRKAPLEHYRRRADQAPDAFDIEAVLALFTPDAVIDDASVGDSFVGHAGVRDYLQRFFVSYRASTRLLSISC